MAGELRILLPFDSLLKATISTRVLRSQDVRSISRLRDIIRDRGFGYCNSEIDEEKRRKRPNWWNEVEQIATDFSWDLFRRPALPSVKVYNGTLEFQDGCHRVIALAVAAMSDNSLANSPVEVILRCN